MSQNLLGSSKYNIGTGKYKNYLISAINSHKWNFVARDKIMSHSQISKKIKIGCSANFESMFLHTYHLTYVTDGMLWPFLFVLQKKVVTLIIINNPPFEKYAPRARFLRCDIFLALLHHYFLC
jgi:hypothetical protein